MNTPYTETPASQAAQEMDDQDQMVAQGLPIETAAETALREMYEMNAIEDAAMSTKGW